jgi:hypothetical protein
MYIVPVLKMKRGIITAGLLAAAALILPVWLVPGEPPPSPDAQPAGGVLFRGKKSDPEACIEESGVTRCCGRPGKKPCRGAEWLHPSLRPVAACLREKLNLGGESGSCPGGIGESFRTGEAQKDMRSLAPGWSLHNYGLAFDACCYFKSHDCSAGNLINKATGGIVTWKKGEEIRCQAKLRLKKGGLGSEDVVEKIMALKEFPDVLEKVKSCYAGSEVKFAEWNWGIGWKDYFDAPHFQYFPAVKAGYYTKKKERKNGAHFFLRILKDCYGGERKVMLEELYAAKTPELFLQKNAAGCGKDAYEMYLDYMAQWK